jgi:hypothetical protein
MFDSFSMRAIQVVAGARFKAGQRGATTIDVGDLLLGLIIEDQGMMGGLLSNVPTEEQVPTRVFPSPSHNPFFPPEIAGQLLTKIENILPQSEPIAQTIEVPLSPELERAFERAKDLQNNFHHEQIKPLHLLAAVLTGESSQYVQLLHEVAITKEQVLKVLRLKLDERQKQLSLELAKAVNDALRESKLVAEVASKGRAAGLDIALHLSGTIKITRTTFPENAVHDRSVLESLHLATDFDESPES